MFTVKKLQKLINQEKFDVGNMPVAVELNGVGLEFIDSADLEDGKLVFRLEQLPLPVVESETNSVIEPVIE